MYYIYNQTDVNEPPKICKVCAFAPIECKILFQNVELKGYKIPKLFAFCYNTAT